MMMSTATKSGVFVHPAAICETTEVGPGTRIWAFAHVLEGAIVGRDCNICDHVFVEDGARLGDRVTVKNGVTIWKGVTLENEVFCGPGVIFTNDRHPRSGRMPEVACRYRRTENWLVLTVVRRGATIGAGAIIVCGVNVGRYASVGAGAIVTHNVPDHALMIGQPARRSGWVCVCGLPLNGDLVCQQCGQRYRPHRDSIEPEKPQASFTS